jgi:hypothetical protein
MTMRSVCSGTLTYTFSGSGNLGQITVSGDNGTATGNYSADWTFTVEFDYGGPPDQTSLIKKENLLP